MEFRTPLAGTISIHAPQWGATVQQWHATANALKFQSTHPSGVRRRSYASRTAPAEFQSTHPSGVRHSCTFWLMMTGVFQSTHPSGVRLSADLRPVFSMPISIHAPQWGATDRSGRVGKNRFISIHAPQWGATPGGWSGVERVDISIHAPQWGATSRETAQCACLRNFNPRTPVGCD